MNVYINLQKCNQAKREQDIQSIIRALKTHIRLLQRTYKIEIIDGILQIFNYINTLNT